MASSGFRSKDCASRESGACSIPRAERSIKDVDMAVNGLLGDKRSKQNNPILLRLWIDYTERMNS